MVNIFPKKLKKGDTLGVFTVSSPVENIKKENLQKMNDYFSSIGLNIFFHPSCFTLTECIMESSKKRATIIHELLTDSKISGLLSFWGGTNTNSILDYLDFNLIKQEPKPIIGYSDTTFLLQSITHKTGIITYYGPAGVTFTKPNPVQDSLNYFEMVCTNKFKGEWISLKEPDEYTDDLYFLNDNPKKRNVKANKGLIVYNQGKAKGEILVGHLFSLLNMISTPYINDFTDKILFIEEAEDFDVNLIYRFFTQLKQINVLTSIKGLVIGKFMNVSKVQEHHIKKILDEVITKRDIPIIYNASFGHTDPVYTIPNGSIAIIDTNNKIIKVKVN